MMSQNEPLVEGILRTVLAKLAASKEELPLSYTNLNIADAVEVFNRLDEKAEGKYRGKYNSARQVLTLLIMPSYLHE